MKNFDIAPATYAGIQADIIGVVESARQAAVRHVNAVMTAAYWLVGRRIIEFEQAGEGRAEYGEALIKRLAVDLGRRFGRGFGAVNLSQMRRFYLTWPPEAIFQTPSEKSRDVDKLQTVSEKSPTQTSHLQILDLAKLAACFPLPWSAYVRLCQGSRRSRLLPDRGFAVWLVRATTRPADRKPVLRADRGVKEQGGNAKDGRIRGAS